MFFAPIKVFTHSCLRWGPGCGCIALNKFLPESLSTEEVNCEAGGLQWLFYVTCNLCVLLLCLYRMFRFRPRGPFESWQKLSWSICSSFSSWSTSSRTDASCAWSGVLEASIRIRMRILSCLNMWTLPGCHREETSLNWFNVLQDLPDRSWQILLLISRSWLYLLAMLAE